MSDFTKLTDLLNSDPSLSQDDKDKILNDLNRFEEKDLNGETLPVSGETDQFLRDFFRGLTSKGLIRSMVWLILFSCAVWSITHSTLSGHKNLVTSSSIHEYLKDAQKPSIPRDPGRINNRTQLHTTTISDTDLKEYHSSPEIVAAPLDTSLLVLNPVANSEKDPVKNEHLIPENKIGHSDTELIDAFTFNDKSNPHSDAIFRKNNKNVIDFNELLLNSGLVENAHDKLMGIESFKGIKITLLNSRIKDHEKTGLHIKKGSKVFIQSYGQILSSICNTAFSAEGLKETDKISNNCQPLFKNYPTGALLYRFESSGKWKVYSSNTTIQIAEQEGELEFTINLKTTIIKTLQGSYDVMVSTSHASSNNLPED